MRDGRPPERWCFICDIRSDGPPTAVVARRLLKHMLRTWGVKCRGFSEDRRIYELMEENKQLRKMVNGLAARVAAQSELLSKRSELSRASR